MRAKDLVERFESVVEKETLIKQDERVSFFEMLTPAFVGGIIIGLLAGIPGLSLLIFLYPLGGYYAVLLVREYYEKNINVKDAAKVGAFAGLLGGFFASLLLIIISIFFAEKAIVFFRGLIGFVNAEFVLTLAGIDPNVSLQTMRIRFLVNIVLCTFLGMVGGVIAGTRRKK